MISDYVLIIGAMKSGTTTIYDYLKRHPEIATGRWKEPGFFAFEEKWALGFDWYEALFSFDPARHRYALDGSTDYTKHPFCKDVVERLKASAPRRFKLIYIMRHPLRRIESHAQHTERTRREIGQCPSPRKTHSLDAGVSPVSLAISRYAYQLDWYAEYFDKGELLLLTLEQLIRDPRAVYARICQFLDIAPLPLPDDAALASNVGRSPASARPLRALHPLWAKIEKTETAQRAARMLIPRALRARIAKKTGAWTQAEGRFRLNADEVRALTDALSPDLRRLRDRYGIDIAKEWAIEL